MRHYSERVKGKNYRDIAGKPLYHWIISTLLECTYISNVVVDTDSPVIMEGLEKHFPTVIRLKRPDHLVDGSISMNTILLHDTDQVPADYYLQTHSTNPVLSTKTITAAIQDFLSKRDTHDSLFSVTRLQTRLYDANGHAVNHNPKELLRTQDLPPIFEENSCIYIFSRQNLETHNHRIGPNPIMFVVPNAQEALDIDEELDFQFCHFVLTQQLKQQEQQELKEE